MLFIYIGCVLQLFLCINYAILTEQMPPKLLEMSLKHVNTLLADVDDRIVYERQLISQFDNETDNDAVTDEAIVPTAMTVPNERVLKAPLTVYQRGLVPYENNFNPTTSVNQAARDLIQLWKLAKIARTVPELIPPDPIDDEEFTISTVSTVTVNRLDLTPIKQLMREYMETQNVSYCVAAVYGALEAVHRKTDEELERWDEEFANTIWKMGREGKLDCFETVLKMRLMALATWSMVTPTVYARRFMHQVYRNLEAGNLLDGKEKEIILTYDSMFTAAEGDELLNSVTVISVRKISDKAVAGMLCEYFLTRFIAPVNRLCKTYELRTLINEVNIAYSNYYPTSSRSARKAIIDSLFENNSTTDKLLRRFLCEDPRDTDCDYKKNVRYLLLKLPTLFQEFLTLKRYSEERKNHLFKLKKYTSNNLHSQTTKLNNKKIETNSKKRNLSVESDLQYFQSRTLKISHKELKSSIDMQTPDFRIRSIYNSNGNYNIRNEQNILNQFHTMKRGHNKTILDQIRDDSSYSDEEMYLRVMLKDAFFHGDNITKT